MGKKCLYKCSIKWYQILWQIFYYCKCNIYLKYFAKWESRNTNLSFNNKLIAVSLIQLPAHSLTHFFKGILLLAIKWSFKQNIADCENGCCKTWNLDLRFWVWSSTLRRTIFELILVFIVDSTFFGQSAKSFLNKIYPILLSTTIGPSDDFFEAVIKRLFISQFLLYPK